MLTVNASHVQLHPYDCIFFLLFCPTIVDLYAFNNYVSEILNRHLSKCILKDTIQMSNQISFSL